MRELEFVFAGLISFLLGLAILFWLKRSAIKHKFLAPAGIPFVGGIAIGLSFFLVCLLIFSGAMVNQIKGILLASLIIWAMGIFDDLRELSVAAKLSVQIIATALLVIFGVRTDIVYLGDTVNIIITFIWVIGITNAFNHLDIIDGLAAVTAVIIAFAFLIISSLNGDFNSVILSLVLIGGVLSFLLRNLPPAKVYMGNSGSHFLGFILAAIALLISYATLEKKAALLSPLVILWLPVFDTTFLVFTRIRKRKMPFNKSNDHLVLRLISLGYSKKKSLLIMSGLGLFFPLCGVMLSRADNLSGLAIFGLILLVTLYVSYRMGGIKVSG
jgi:UDP-GlcNAc:undecaprenyl-phosphate/decaprenyl-phosphate GlcNAc-1-phosphate transferase